MKVMDYNTRRYAGAAAAAGLCVAVLVSSAAMLLSPPAIECPRHVVSGDLTWRAVSVFAGTTGDVDRVLRGYAAGQLADARFAMPGWRGPKGRRHRGGRR